MYTIDEIKELIAVLENTTLAVIELQKEDGSKIRLEKPQTVQQITAQTIPVQTQAPVVSSNALSVAPQAPVTPKAVTEDSTKNIKAPIVGVFYASPAPNSKPYVSVGDTFKKGDTVCIIEAMKCMNEIQAEEDGTITEVLVKDGELVEYGQPLFKFN